MNKREKTKALIIDKTKELISKNGDITIKEISEACYINIAAVNYHFGSKENLVSIVIDDIIKNLTDEITEQVKKLDYDEDFEKSLAIMLEIIYKFTIENTGVIRYLFLNNDYQLNSTNILVNSFFSENEFTRTVIDHLMKSMKITDRKKAYAKYVLLFSSFSIPLFIEIAKNKDDKNLIASIVSKDFRENYISEILKLIN